MFRFRLARALGKTVAEMLEQMDGRELTEWHAYDRLEPIDHIRRQELAAATTSQTLGNIHRNQNHDRFKASDFMVEWGAAEREPVMPAELIPIADKIDDVMNALKVRWETPEEKLQSVQQRIPPMPAGLPVLQQKDVQ